MSKNLCTHIIHFCLSVSSVAQSCLTVCDPMDCSTSGFPVYHSPPELTQTHVHRVGDAIQPSHPVIPFSSCLQSFPASGSFQCVTSLHQVSREYWSFSLNISPSNEYPGLISFRIDWLDLLAVQGTLKSLLQHHSSKASMLQHSAFFTVQLSHPYMTTGKTIALTRQIFAGKSLFINLFIYNISKFISTIPSQRSTKICSKIIEPEFLPSEMADKSEIDLRIQASKYSIFILFYLMSTRVLVSSPLFNTFTHACSHTHMLTLIHIHSIRKS